MGLRILAVGASCADVDASLIASFPPESHYRILQYDGHLGGVAASVGWHGTIRSLEFGSVRQIGLVGEINDAFLDDLVIDRLKSIAVFNCVRVSFGVEF